MMMQVYERQKEFNILTYVWQSSWRRFYTVLVLVYILLTFLLTILTFEKNNQLRQKTNLIEEIVSRGGEISSAKLNKLFVSCIPLCNLIIKNIRDIRGMSNPF
jgi:glycopeptide antibiotics resistance protein